MLSPASFLPSPRLQGLSSKSSRSFLAPSWTEAHWLVLDLGDTEGQVSPQATRLHFSFGPSVAKLKCSRCASSLALCHPCPPAAARPGAGSPPPAACSPRSPKHAATRRSQHFHWTVLELAWKHAFSSGLTPTLSTGVVATQRPWRMMHAQKGPCEHEGGTEGYARAQFDIRVPGPASHLLSSVLRVLNFGITAKMRTPWRRGALPCARDRPTSAAVF